MKKGFAPGKYTAWGRNALAAAACMLAFGNAVNAAETKYPTDPINLVVPFPPGGSVDTVARIMAPQLERQLGQRIIIENRGGANSVIGAEYVKRAKPDGYTILLNASLQVANPGLLTSAHYDAINDFVPITEIGALPQIVVVSAKSPYKTMNDLVGAARNDPGKLTWAIAAFGAAEHFACELVNVQAKVDMPVIPYKGGSPGLVDVMGGQVTAMIEPMASAYPQVQSGNMRALAVASPERMPTVPGLPTMNESGFHDFDMPSWYGLWAPAKTPRHVVDRLNQAVRNALKDPAVMKRMASIDFVPVGSSSEDFAKYQLKQMTQYNDLVKQAGIKVD